MRWDVYCRVIDNHGDLGVCWRLARELTALGEQVRLWVDDASALAWMAPGATEGRLGVAVRPWGHAPAAEPADVVVEAFGCDPPSECVARMAAASPPPVWINLEYLSAEAWVERSHGLASPQQAGPGAGLVKWFFFPGFTRATGGLLGAAAKAAGRHEAPPEAAAAVEARLREGAAAGPAGDTRPIVFLFCYRNPALPAWIDAWRAAGVRLMVAPGWPTEAVQRALQLAAARPGDRAAFGRSTAQFLPYGDQAWFDAWLLRADFNIVRGEDSWIRALWAGRPFIWQPYAQPDRADRAKLEAFLDRYLAPADAAVADEIRSAHRAWNTEAYGGPGAARPGGAASPAWQRFAAQRSAELAREVPDLASALLGLAKAKR